MTAYPECGGIHRPFHTCVGGVCKQSDSWPQVKVGFQQCCLFSPMCFYFSEQNLWALSDGGGGQTAWGCSLCFLWMWHFWCHRTLTSMDHLQLRVKWLGWTVAPLNMRTWAFTGKGWTVHSRLRRSYCVGWLCSAVDVHWAADASMRSLM